MVDSRRKAPIGSRSRRGVRTKMQVPVNLERVLLEAGKNPAFYRALVTDRARALAEHEYRLRDSEQAMLSALPIEALDRMIQQLKPDKLKKSQFARRVATAIAGTVLLSSSGCSDSQTKGSEPDMPIDAAQDVTQSDSGIDAGDGETVVTGGIPSIGGSGGGGVGPDWPGSGGYDSGQGGAGGEPDSEDDSGV